MFFALSIISVAKHVRADECKRGRFKDAFSLFLIKPVFWRIG